MSHELVKASPACGTPFSPTRLFSENAGRCLGTHRFPSPMSGLDVT